MPCDGVALVLEVTSSKPGADRETKRRCYARGGIPLYLLVDREAGAVTLFSDPEGHDYREHGACNSPLRQGLDYFPRSLRIRPGQSDFLDPQGGAR
ncbi:hypothetical protein SGLAM104S_06366 [Streptomyces glaucescens]